MKPIRVLMPAVSYALSLFVVAMMLGFDLMEMLETGVVRPVAFPHTLLAMLLVVGAQPGWLKVTPSEAAA